MKRATTWFLLLLLLFFGALYVYRMGEPSLFEEDEARVTEVAREIVTTGKWIDIQHNYEPWFHKPPLYPWLTSLAFLVLGRSEFAARIWALIFTIAAMAATFFLARAVYDEGTGLLATTILGSSLLIVTYARAGFVDSALMFFVASSILFFLLYYRDPVERRYLYVSAVLMALGTLTKGPLGAILPASTAFLFLLAGRDLKFIKENIRPIGLGMLVFFLVAAPWWVAEAALHGRAFIRGLFGMYMIGIYSSTFQKHSGPWYFYLPVILIGMIPWSAHLIYGVGRALKKDERGRAALLLLWAAVVLALFSSAQTKVPGYILPIFPPLAILTAHGMQRLRRSESPGSWRVSAALFGANAVLMLLLLVGVHVIKVQPEFVKFIMIFRATLFAFFALSVAGLVLSLRKNYHVLSVASLVMIAVVFIISASGWILPAFEYYKPSRRLVEEVKRAVPEGAGAEYFIYRAWFRSSLVFYLERKVNVLNSKGEVLSLLSSGEKFVLFTDPDRFRKVFSSVPAGMRKISREFDLEAYTNID